MDYILKVISLPGGLALFLFGMDVTGNSLERQAGGNDPHFEYSIL